MKDVALTTHGLKRVRQRMGLPKKSVPKNAEKAYEFGVHRKEATGSLRRYMDCIYHGSRSKAEIVVYNRFVYVFGYDRALVTAMNVPKEYIPLSDAAQKKKKEKLYED